MSFPRVVRPQEDAPSSRGVHPAPSGLSSWLFGCCSPSRDTRCPRRETKGDSGGADNNNGAETSDDTRPTPRSPLSALRSSLVVRHSSHPPGRSQFAFAFTSTPPPTPTRHKHTHTTPPPGTASPDMNHRWRLFSWDRSTGRCAPRPPKNTLHHHRHHHRHRHPHRHRHHHPSLESVGGTGRGYSCGVDGSLRSPSTPSTPPHPPTLDRLSVGRVLNRKHRQPPGVVYEIHPISSRFHTLQDEHSPVTSWFRSRGRFQPIFIIVQKLV